MREQLMGQGLTAEQIERVMEPTLAFQAQFVEEVQWYERVKAGDLAPIHNLNELGQMLIGLRIARGMTQRELAERLGIAESAISRDERNDYHGISIERAQRILDALEGQATMIVSPLAQSREPARELAAV
jgi:DNA-binding XRE family transcriptional regulator